jgi:hypothetical protein
VKPEEAGRVSHSHTPRFFFQSSPAALFSGRFRRLFPHAAVPQLVVARSTFTGRLVFVLLRLRVWF